MDYKTFIEAMDDLAMGIGDIADRLEITVEEVQNGIFGSVPQEAIDLARWKKIKLSKLD